jgi:hypothetical protein
MPLSENPDCNEMQSSSSGATNVEFKPGLKELGAYEAWVLDPLNIWSPMLSSKENGARLV